MSKIYFINTFEPVVPLYRDVFPYLKESGYQPCAVISSKSYRDGKEARQDYDFKVINMPNIIRSRRMVAVAFYIIAPFYILRFPKNSHVVFLSQPPMFYIIGAFLSKIRGFSYTLHVMDLYPDLLMKHKLLRNRSMIKKMLGKLSEYSFKSASKIFVIGRCMNELMSQKNIDIKKLEIIQNWPDESLERYTGDGSIFRKKYNLNDKFLVMYSGNMGEFHIFETILSVAKLTQNIKKLAFVFIGKGGRKHEIENAINSGIRNIVLLDHLPNDDYADALLAGNIHFASLRKGYEGLLVPSKFYGILAIGRPIMYEGRVSGELARTINENKCGQVIEQNDCVEMKRCILKYMGDSGLELAHGTSSRKTYEDFYSRKKMARRYANSLIQQILNNE
jgi:colanic acid biosynthesis glycosyl transferase WcaI